MDEWGDVGGPIEQPDGTLHCAAHDLEFCGRCCVDYTWKREILEQEKRERTQRDSEEPQRGPYAISTQCIHGCNKKATLLCSACKVGLISNLHPIISKTILLSLIQMKKYCGVVHQKADWLDNHKAACAQLVHQLTASAKIRAVFTRAFTIYESDRPTPHPAYDELQPLGRYTVIWKKNGRKGEELFKWRGTETKGHSFAPSSGPFASYPVTSCSLAQRVDFMKTEKDDEAVRQGGLHALANIDDQDTFYGMAINFVTYGTILPFAPCRCHDDEEQEDEDEDECKGEDKEVTVVKVQPMPEWWKDGRDWWDHPFRRAQASRRTLLIQLVY